MANAKKKGVVKDSAFFAMIGRQGGMKTKQRQLRDNPNYYSEIGLKGGEIMRQTRGKDFYSKIGKMSKRTKADEGENQTEGEAESTTSETTQE
jgi:general stress protein YciG